MFSIFSRLHESCRGASDSHLTQRWLLGSGVWPGGGRDEAAGTDGTFPRALVAGTVNVPSPCFPSPCFPKKCPPQSCVFPASPCSPGREGLHRQLPKQSG